MFPPVVLLDRFGGIARGTFLQQFGCTRKQLAADVRIGSIHRVRPGVFAIPTADARVVSAAAHGGALTCNAALRFHGIWILPDPDDEVHVWMGAAGRSHPHERCVCVVHYSPGRAELGLAPVAAALVHAYRCLSQEAFFAAYESAWNKRLISATDRARIRRELPKTAGWLLDLARADAESGLESLLRLRLHLLGIQLECQVAIDGVGRVDFVIGGRVILEADGKDNHTGAKRHKDLMRDAAASVLGYETLHFDYAMILHNWDLVVAAILPAIARARA
ncbi:endonuclease domain-containing protein [Microbacterium sp. A94]|uniref:endonuclease domain-containing protein n=1 Tax=Microbacterium sp. A94 TaxID=3450717 RepID=UPI003F443A91